MQIVEVQDLNLGDKITFSHKKYEVISYQSQSPNCWGSLDLGSGGRLDLKNEKGFVEGFMLCQKHLVIRDNGKNWDWKIPAQLAIIFDLKFGDMIYCDVSYGGITNVLKPFVRSRFWSFIKGDDYGYITLSSGFYPKKVLVPRRGFIVKDGSL